MPRPLFYLGQSPTPLMDIPESAGNVWMFIIISSGGGAWPTGQVRFILRPFSSASILPRTKSQRFLQQLLFLAEQLRGVQWYPCGAQRFSGTDLFCGCIPSDGIPSVIILQIDVVQMELSYHVFSAPHREKYMASWPLNPPTTEMSRSNPWSKPWKQHM